MTDPTRDPNQPPHVERRDAARTRDEVHTDAERHVDRDIEESGWLMGLVRRFSRNSEVEQRFTEQLAAQAGDLAAGVSMRTPPAMPCANYLSYPHAQLKPMVTQDVSPEDVGAMSDLYTQAGNAMVRFQNEVAAAIANSQTQWEGPAGDAARRFLADTGDWIGQAGQSAQYAGTQLALHSAALAEAKNSMPEERPFDLGAAMRDLQATTDPLAFATKAAGYLDEYRASQAAHEEAARVVGAYDGRLSAAAAMPAFAPPPAMCDARSDEPVRAHDARAVDRDTDVSVRDTQTGPSGVEDVPQGHQRDSHTPLSAVASGQSSEGGSVPAPRDPASATAPGQRGPGTTPGGYDPGLPAGAGPLAGPVGPSGSQPAPVPVGGPPPVGGPGGLPGSEAVRGTGRAPASALAAQQAAGRASAVGARTAAGMVGAPVARGAEDDEHDRPTYLVEPDPDEVFGAGGSASPPVIG
ncbi:hypothetical protein [Actinokineospora sp. UTMC 2448]|uniref:hypothetical protein n=1 Tax=Actinokineospora sp. UTMC 2448 TaxID=2268449 RepID=UPI0021644C7A|nr:hypothetical protein [Actinokineospora sp. UTMC 2448]UVS82455.1 hypothetical protein Actkin_06228 [Actinokineospora sp. UTMC 2448]